MICRAFTPHFHKLSVFWFFFILLCQILLEHCLWDAIFLSETMITQPSLLMRKMRRGPGHPPQPSHPPWPSHPPRPSHLPRQSRPQIRRREPQIRGLRKKYFQKCISLSLCWECILPLKKSIRKNSFPKWRMLTNIPNVCSLTSPKIVKTGGPKPFQRLGRSWK